MKIILRCGGVVRQGPERELVNDFIQRANGLTSACGFRNVSEEQVDLRREKTRSAETQKLLPRVDGSIRRVILDERGKALTSRDIARYVSQLRDDGISEFQLVIGGADGFEPVDIPPGTQKWSFGVQTWPHKLVRVMAAEQIYRSLSILAQTPYHRD